MNEPLGTDPNNEHKDTNDIPSMLGQMALGLGLLALFGLSISQCSKKLIENGYIGSGAKQKQELLRTLDNQKPIVATMDF